MQKSLLFLFVTLLVVPAAWAQDADEPESIEAAAAEAEDASSAAAAPAKTSGDPALDKSGPKTLSGMSILGNEETPKSLVIVPWKSSEMGDELSLNDTLDEQARPVDKEVFLRELNFYRIRSGEQ